MSTGRLVVLIDPDPRDLATFQNAAAQETGASVVTARSWLQGLAMVRAEQPELVVAGASIAEGGVDPLARAVKDAAVEHVPRIAVIVAGAIDAGWSWIEADALTHPVSPSQARAVLRAAIAARSARAALAGAQALVQKLNAALQQERKALVEVLLGIVELRLPGARERAALRLGLARDLCERLTIPAELHHDLAIAVQLQELGYLAVAERDSWRATQSARAILEAIPGFETAAELMGEQLENWDGTGMPGHLQQGQIPLRSRILRVVLDYVDALEDPRAAVGDVAAVLERMGERSGTSYDPMVLVHLRALAGNRTAGDWHLTRMLVPVEKLGVGMVLAEDLYTDSGIKLLSQGTEISASTLETILRRHRSDPMLHGAAVLRRSA